MKIAILDRQVDSALFVYNQITTYKEAQVCPYNGFNCASLCIMKGEKGSMKNRKKLTAVALATVMGLSYTSYPVYAQEEIKKNVSNPVENVNAQEQNSKINETVTKQNETTKNNKLTNEVKMYAENNAGSFNVTSGTAGTDWTYDSDANTLTFNNSGTYTVTGDGTETQEKIVVAHNFEGTITINNININVSSKLGDCAFEVNNTATLTLNLKGENILKSGYGRAGLEFSNATTKSSLTITSDSNGKLTTTGGSDSAGIGGKLGSPDSYSGGNHITINSGTVIATAGGGAAGIGGGRWGNGENITINGGVVIATSDNGAGIGSGMDGNAENITITGGKIIATSNNGAGIGNGGNSGTAKKNYHIRWNCNCKGYFWCWNWWREIWHFRWHYNKRRYCDS